MRNIEELSEIIVGVLSEYKGFENWWYNIEDNDQEDILEDLQDNIAEWMNEQPCSSD
jgi:hypothetical protein